jgi:hypothetical protein
LHCAETYDTRNSDGSATIEEAQIENIDFKIKFQSIESYTEEKNTSTILIDKFIEHSRVRTR